MNQDDILEGALAEIALGLKFKQIGSFKLKRVKIAGSFEG